MLLLAALLFYDMCLRVNTVSMLKQRVTNYYSVCVTVQIELAEIAAPTRNSPVWSTQVRVVQGPGTKVVRPPGGLQHDARDRWPGVHWLPLQRLVHGHRDWREGLLRHLTLQHSGGSVLCQNTSPLEMGEESEARIDRSLVRREACVVTK